MQRLLIYCSAVSLQPACETVMRRDGGILDIRFVTVQIYDNLPATFPHVTERECEIS